MTVIPLAGGGGGGSVGGVGAASFRVMMNRDEEVVRPPAHEPRWRDMLVNNAARPARAIWPTDPLGGGTWIGANDHGLVCCLLNGNPRKRPVLPSAERILSRGVIIPEVLVENDGPRAIAAACEMPLSRFAPFRLVAIDMAERGGAGAGGGGVLRVIDLRWNGRARRTRVQTGEAVCFVSSGLGDHVVSERLPLFEQMVASRPSPAAQEAFHQHEWADRPEVSVMMCRSDARTVSITSVTVRNGVTMDYTPIDRLEAGELVSR